jgi:hypothetical protein
MKYLEKLLSRAKSSPNRFAKSCVPYIKTLQAQNTEAAKDLVIHVVSLDPDDPECDRDIDPKAFDLWAHTPGKGSRDTADATLDSLSTAQVIRWKALKQALRDRIKEGDTPSDYTPSVTIYMEREQPTDAQADRTA